jgi:8-oxo-dGTP pyrophosphatase MutT (NUDIX family)
VRRRALRVHIAARRAGASPRVARTSPSVAARCADPLAAEVAQDYEGRERARWMKAVDNFDPAPLAEVLWRLLGEGARPPAGAHGWPRPDARTPNLPNRPDDGDVATAERPPAASHVEIAVRSAPGRPERATPDLAVQADVEGWFSMVEVCRALSEALAQQIQFAHLHALSTVGRHRGASEQGPAAFEARVEIRDMRIRLIPVAPASAPPPLDATRLARPDVRPDARQEAGRAPHRGPLVPDLLFHATTEANVQATLRTGLLSAAHDGPPGWGPQGRRHLLLSASEEQAWRAAHRIAAQRASMRPRGPRDATDLAAVPRVLVVDVPRARRAGVRFAPHRPDAHRSWPLFSTWEIPARHLLDLHDGFDTQMSAGGIPVRRGADGRLRMALVRVGRRSGTTWEVAKGKLEPGETPEAAAIREVQEEMGFTARLEVLRFVAPVRYGFLAPGGQPRLKTVFLYLLHALDDQLASADFQPATAEGIQQVGWFLPEEATNAVTHPSLIPAMALAAELVSRHGLTRDVSSTG